MHPENWLWIGFRSEGGRLIPFRTIIHSSSGTTHTSPPDYMGHRNRSLCYINIFQLEHRGAIGISRMGRNNRIFIPLIHIQFFCLSSFHLSFSPSLLTMHMRFGCISHLNESSVAPFLPLPTLNTHTLFLPHCTTLTGQRLPPTSVKERWRTVWVKIKQ